MELCQEDTEVNLKGLPLAKVGIVGALGRKMTTIDLYT